MEREYLKGSEHGRARLTDEQVLQIRKLKEEGKPRKQIAREFGITPQYVSEIVLRRKWRHI